MKKIISITVAAAMSALSIPALAFSDVNTSTQLSQSTTELQSLGVISGYEDGTFRPYNEITRAEIAKIALNLFPKTVNPGVSTISVSGSSLYTDIDTSFWADSVIGRMSAMNIFNGYEDGTFRPNSPVTYQEALKIIVEMLNYGDAAANSGGYPSGYINIAKDLGITENLEFTPTDNATRGDISIMVYNSLDIPCCVMTSYIVGSCANYEIDENLTFRKMITNKGV
jgi:hypothetical protein